MTGAESTGAGSNVFSRQARRDLAIVFGLAVVGILVRYGVFLATFRIGGFDAYLDDLCVWDCAWYRTIIEEGYDLAPGIRYRPGGANWAFFPLQPLGIAALHTLFGLPTLVAGFLLSNLYILIAALAARPLFGANIRAYWLWVFALLIGPFSVLFSTLHTESLFILLTVLTLVALQRRRYLHAGGWAALLSATRVTGVLMGIAILVSAIADQRRDGTPWRQIPGRLLPDADLVLGLCLAPLGLFCYMAYLQLLSGDGLAFLHIQRAWGRDVGQPLSALWQALAATPLLTPDSMLTTTWGWSAVLGLGLSVVLLLTGRQAAGTFTGLAILTSLSTGVTSMIRFSAGLVPLGMIASELFARWTIVYYATFPVVFLLGLATTAGWFRSSVLVM